MPQTGGSVTVSSLTTADPFYIAHRGGGGDWPELTAYAYEQATKIPELHALEISVCISSDGVLVCSHDPTTTRLTGQPYTIADTPWSTLSTLMVSGIETTHAKQPAQPFTRFDDVVDRYIGDYVLFVEPKVSPASRPLMARMAALGQPQRVVWKQPINSTLFAEAKSNGFSTWGYVLDETAHLGDNLTRYAGSSDIDMLGAPQGASEELISSVVNAASSRGKKTIAWPIRNVDDRTRIMRLGCQGLMTSNVTEVLKVPV